MRGSNQKFGVAGELPGQPGFSPRSLLTRTVTGSEAKTATCHYSSDADTASWVVDSVDSVVTTTRYVNGGGGLLAEQVVGGAVSYPLYTPHGDVWAWTDDTGVVTGTFNYDEYGNPLQPVTGTEGVDRYGWLGRQQREWDAEVGVTLMGVRGYDPVLGRFLSVDPVRGGSANDYDYVAGDPVNNLDLDGRRMCKNARDRKCKRPKSGGFGGTVSVTACAIVCSSVGGSRAGGRGRAVGGLSFFGSPGVSLLWSPGRPKTSTGISGGVCVVVCLGFSKETQPGRGLSVVAGFGVRGPWLGPYGQVAKP